MCVLQPCGDAKELYCAQGEGEVARVVRLTRTPQNDHSTKGDNFASERPIIAVVKKGRCAHKHTHTHTHTLSAYIL